MRRLWPALSHTAKAAGKYRYNMGIKLWVGEVKVKA